MSADDKCFQMVFTALKPACDAFITETNDVNTNNLKDVLTKVPEYGLQSLQPYILIPLEMNFKTSK